MVPRNAAIAPRQAVDSSPLLYKRTPFSKKIKQNSTLLLMCLPAILFFFAFAYAPMPGAYIAFTKFEYNKGIFGSRFVGFANFKFLFESGQLSLLLRNTMLYNVAFILIGNFLQLTFAILMNEVKSKAFKKITQSMMFLPHFISAVLVGLLVYNLINYDFGFISSLVRVAGGTMPKLYSTPAAWPYIILAAVIWQTTGYGTVVYFAAITGIDESMLEAARVDGANGFQRIRHIILPCLKPTVAILLLFAVGGIVKGNFGVFYNLVGLNSVLFKTTDIVETYVYRALMNNFNFTQSSAVGLFQSLIGFAIVMIANGVVRHIEPDYSLF